MPVKEHCNALAAKSKSSPWKRGGRYFERSWTASSLSIVCGIERELPIIKYVLEEIPI